MQFLYWHLYLAASVSEFSTTNKTVIPLVAKRCILYGFENGSMNGVIKFEGNSNSYHDNTSAFFMFFPRMRRTLMPLRSSIL